MDQLIQWDHELFRFVNQDLANSFFDAVLPWMREKKFWIPLYIIIAFLTYRKWGWQAALIMLAGAGLTILLSDAVIAGSFKSYFQRSRPCNSDIQVRLLVKCGSGKSFISAHACNHFALGMYIHALLGKVYKWILPVALLWAATIAFSQVYVGVHYPADVTVGSIMGVLAGLGIGTLVYKYIFRKYMKKKEEKV